MEIDIYDNRFKERTGMSVVFRRVSDDVTDPPPSP